MISDEKFAGYIGQLSEQYEEFKDAIRRSVNVLSPECQDLINRLVDFRDTACKALRDSHTTADPGQN
jgi:hypothetical protein